MFLMPGCVAGHGKTGDREVAGSDKWAIRLGRLEWLRFTYERPAEDGLRLLGSVSRGARAGALAMTPQGQYVQINGDHESPLSAGQIRRALANASASRVPAGNRARAGAGADRKAPVVVIKRRRQIEPA